MGLSFYIALCSYRELQEIPKLLLLLTFVGAAYPKQVHSDDVHIAHCEEKADDSLNYSAGRERPRSLLL